MCKSESQENYAKRDLSAFAEIVDKYRNLIFGFCYHKVGNFEDAEDLTQQVFINAYRSRKALRDPAKTTPWLCKIAANLCKMWFRSRHGKKTVPIEGIGEQEDPSPTLRKQIETGELQSLVKAALGRLSEDHRLVTTLFYLQGRSYAEIADFLGIPAKIVKSRLHESRKQLRKEILRIVEKTFGNRRLSDEFTEEVLCKCGCLSKRR